MSLERGPSAGGMLSQACLISWFDTIVGLMLDGLRASYVLEADKMLMIGSMVRLLRSFARSALRLSSAESSTSLDGDFLSCWLHVSWAKYGM